MEHHSSLLYINSKFRANVCHVNSIMSSTAVIINSVLYYCGWTVFLSRIYIIIIDYRYGTRKLIKLIFYKCSTQGWCKSSVGFRLSGGLSYTDNKFRSVLIFTDCLLSMFSLVWDDSQALCKEKLIHLNW